MELKASVEMGVLHTGKAVFKTVKNDYFLFRFASYQKSRSVP